MQFAVYLSVFWEIVFVVAGVSGLFGLVLEARGQVEAGEGSLVATFKCFW